MRESCKRKLKTFSGMPGIIPHPIGLPNNRLRKILIPEPTKGIHLDITEPEILRLIRLKTRPIEGFHRSII